jgi:hypothetical protein
MKCPDCQKEIEMVVILSNCTEEGFVRDGKITGRRNLTIVETRAIECSECGCELHGIEET